MPNAFEWFVAARYLRARRKEKVVSVVTVISIAGVAAGVMALIISMAVNTGFRETLQRNLLGAAAHVNLVEKEAGRGIEDWRGVMAKVRLVGHVVAASPALYDQVVLTGSQNTRLIVLKGIDAKAELTTSDVLKHLKAGSLTDMVGGCNDLPGLVIGEKAAQGAGVMLHSRVKLISPMGNLTPFGPQPRSQWFCVAGIFDAGFFDLDDNWAYAPLGAVQNLSSLGDVVNSIDIRLDDSYLARQVGAAIVTVAGARYAATNWQDQNKRLMSALESERAVTAITIGLIELVAAMNILITLTMIVLTKYKDIAVLMSVGARRSQILRIFVIQGAMIGVVGTTLGAIAGYVLCYFADKYQWIKLDESVYMLRYVPFEPRVIDGVWIVAAALVWSLIATLYPARNAMRIEPVEVLRYE